MRLHYADYWNVHHRKSTRLEGYDYSQAAMYFITICTVNKECLLGEILDEKMILNEFGRLANYCWLTLPRHFPHVSLDAFVIMPNHVHGILQFNNVADVQSQTDARERGGACPAPTTGAPATLGTVIGSFKSATTKFINIVRDAPGETIWQRSFHDRIIRTHMDVVRIRQYIADNPKNWLVDGT